MPFKTLEYKLFLTCVYTKESTYSNLLKFLIIEKVFNIVMKTENVSRSFVK